MKKALFAVGAIVVLITVFGLFACDNNGGGGGSRGTLTVGIIGAPPETDDKVLHTGLYVRDADPLSASLLAVGDIVLGTDYSEVVMRDPITDETTVFEAGGYDLYTWIDMNDNFDTVQAPEVGIDMSYLKFPIPVTISGDHTIIVMANYFELFPGY